MKCCGGWIDRRIALLLLGVLLLLANGSQGFAQSPSGGWVTPGELLIKLRPGVSLDSEAWQRFVRAQHIRQVHLVSPALPGVVLLRFSPARDWRSIDEACRRSGLVLEAEPNYLRPTQAITPNDPRYPDQWEMPILQMPEAWQIERGDPSVIIAIVDTGTDLDHVDLKPNLWVNPGEIPDNGVDDDGNGYVDDVHGWDFVDAPNLPGRGDFEERDNDPSDETGHGTHVMGIAGARGNNARGIAGVAWNCTLMPVRAGFAVVGGGTYLQDDDSAAAIIYAADNGARVINMSWGDQVNAFVIRDAIHYAAQKGCVLVAAAGNEREAKVLYPAALRSVIAVSATDENDEHAYFANMGADVDIAAPGSVIWSTHIGNRYRRESGTSMAAPHVAGAAALLLSRRPALTAEDVRQILIATADPLPGDETLVDAGRLNVANALKAASAPVVRLLQPETGMGADRQFTVVGSALGVGFQGYRLLYGRSAQPERWFPISVAGDHPRWQDVLGTWDVSQLEEAAYALRLEVDLRGGKTLRDQVVVYVDHTPPQIQDLEAGLWLREDRYATLITWRTDDVTRDQVWVRTKRGLDPFEALLTESTGTKHLLALSNYLDSGEYEFWLLSRNAAGLETREDNGGRYYSAYVTHEHLSPHGAVRWAATLPAMHVADGSADFDGDGTLDFVMMPIGESGYAPVAVFTYRGRWRKLAESEEPFFPWGVGDLDGDGVPEILGNVKERTFLLEGDLAAGFPNRRIWEAQPIWGGRFARIAGREYLITRDSRKERIVLFRAMGNDQIEQVAALPNPSEGRNNLVSQFAVGDFDADGRVDLLAGDDDGDLFLYEHQGGDAFALVWQTRLEGERIQHLAAGDTDADGQTEFVVGSRSQEDKFSLMQEHWVYRVFERVAEDRYRIAWRQPILEVRPGGNGMAVADVDRVPGEDILVVTWPSAYLFAFRDGDYRPLWYHEASSTFQPHVVDLDRDGQVELMFNASDQLQMFEWQEGTASLIPWNLSAIPLDDHRVQLHWQHAPGIPRFQIYRGTSETALKRLGTVQEARFLDEGLTSGQTYWYAVASITADGVETERSEAVEATPGPPPRVVAVRFLPPARLEVQFDSPMHDATQDIHNYQVAREEETTWHRPDSALLLRGKRLALLNFPPSIFETGGTYRLQVAWVYSQNKVRLQPNPTEVRFQVAPPQQPAWNDLSQAVVYPNPVRPSTRHPGWVTFAHLPTGTAITIYTPDGAQVAALEVGPGDAGQKRWLLDNGVHSVASGVYTYILEWNAQRKVGQISVVW